MGSLTADPVPVQPGAATRGPSPPQSRKDEVLLQDHQKHLQSLLDQFGKRKTKQPQEESFEVLVKVSGLAEHVCTWSCRSLDTVWKVEKELTKKLFSTATSDFHTQLSLVHKSQKLAQGVQLRELVPAAETSAVACVDLTMVRLPPQTPIATQPGPWEEWARYRLTREYEFTQKDHPALHQFLGAKPCNGDLFSWTAYIVGQPGTPYSGGIFHFDLHYSESYPHNPPRIVCTTPIFHCNFHKDGAVCLADSADCPWSPALTVSTMLMTLLARLDQPITEQPLVPEIASLYETNRELHDRYAQEWVQKYAIASPPVAQATVLYPWEEGSSSATEPAAKRPRLGSP